VDWDRVTAIVENRCGHWPAHAPERTTTHMAGLFEQDRLVQPTSAREHLCLMSEGVSAQDPRRFAAMILASIVGDDAGSRYYWELVDPAIAEVAAMQFGAMDGTGTFYSYFRCDPANRDRVLTIVNKIFEDLQQQGITEAELTKAQNKLLSALVIKNELPMGRLVDMGFNWNYLKTYRTVQEDVAAIKAVTRIDVNDLVAALSPGRFTSYAIGP
jgi:predicted Zn-dependent peptidase